MQNNRLTLKEFLEDYECERKFEEIYVIINGRLRNYSLDKLINMPVNNYFDYFVVNWTHMQNSMVIDMVSDYDAWLKMIDYRDEVYAS